MPAIDPDPAAFRLVAISLLMQSLTEVVGKITDYIFSDDFTLWTVDPEHIPGPKNLTYPDKAALFGIMILVVMIILLFILETWIVPVFGRFSAKVSVYIRKGFMWSALNLPIDLSELRLYICDGQGTFHRQRHA